MEKWWNEASDASDQLLSKRVWGEESLSNWTRNVKAAAERYYYTIYTAERVQYVYVRIEVLERAGTQIRRGLIIIINGKRSKRTGVCNDCFVVCGVIVSDIS